MKKWFLLCGLFLLSPKCLSFSGVAEFENRGQVRIEENTQGIRLVTDLQLEPDQRYMVRLLSSCRSFVPYWVRYRQSFSLKATSNKNGYLSVAKTFVGLNHRDLVSRNLNTAAIFNFQKTHWKLLSCAPIRMGDDHGPEIKSAIRP